MHKLVLGSLLVSGLLPLAALEMAATDPAAELAYLQEEVRPSWRGISVDKALEQVHAWIDRPLELSRALAAEREDREAADKDRKRTYHGPRIHLIQRERISLKELLVILERAKGLHFTAEPLRLLVETDVENRVRRRRLVNVDMRDYAHSFMATDFDAPELGFAVTHYGGGGFDTFGAMDEDEGLSYTLDDFTEMMEVAAGDRADEDGFMLSMRSSGNVHIRATPEEEQAMRDVLAYSLERRTRRTAWRVSFGLLPAGQGLAQSGVVTGAQASQALAGLVDVKQLLVTGLQGQQVAAADVRQVVGITDADVSGHDRLDPVVESINVGRAAQWRVVAARNFKLVTGRLSWVEQLDRQERPIAGMPQAASTDWSLELEGEVAGLAQDERPADDEDEPERDVNLSGEAERERHGALPAERFSLQHLTLWSWQPPIDIMLPHDAGMILMAAHPRGTAVIVVEEVQP